MSQDVGRKSARSVARIIENLYSGRINMDRWKDIRRKKLGDAGKTPKTRKGKKINVKYISK
jgi:hypothetical protein